MLTTPTVLDEYKVQKATQLAAQAEWDQKVAEGWTPLCGILPKPASPDADFWIAYLLKMSPSNV